jgi:hypothetical protein
MHQCGTQSSAILEVCSGIKKLQGDVTDTSRHIIMEDMVLWAYNNRCNINIGVSLEKKMIDSIISLRFNPRECVAQYTTAEQGISILAFRARSTQETESLKAQELAEEKTVAIRRYEELLKLVLTTVCILASSYQDIKLNIATFCAILFGLCSEMNMTTTRR